MATVESEEALSISRIARAAGLKRWTVSALIEHYRLPVFNSPRLISVKPEARARLISILESHPGVEPGLDDRL